MMLLVFCVRSGLVRKGGTTMFLQLPIQFPLQFYTLVVVAISVVNLTTVYLSLEIW